MVLKQHNEQEYLDSADVSFQERSHLLAELDRTNKMLGVYRYFKKYFIRWLEQLPSPQSTSEPIRILEIGGGSGGLAIQLIPFLKGHGYNVDYHVLDIHTDILEWAKNRVTEYGHSISIHNGGDQHLKIFSDHSFDIVISLHTLHHIHPQGVLAQAFDDMMRISKCGFFMTDLVRRYDSLWILKIISPFLGIPETLYHDGIKSVRRSYTTREMKKILKLKGNNNHFSISVRPLILPYQIISGIRNK